MDDDGGNGQGCGGDSVSDADDVNCVEFAGGCCCSKHARGCDGATCAVSGNAGARSGEVIEDVCSGGGDGDDIGGVKVCEACEEGR